MSAAWSVTRGQVLLSRGVGACLFPHDDRVIIAQHAAMSARQVFEWRKPESVSHTWDMMYDDYWAPRFRRPPDIHELARRARGESPLDAPVPLPRHRKRALTNPLPAFESIQSMSYSIRRSRQRTDDQATCLFLTKLPIEIRQMVYEEVLAAGGNGSVVHILRKHGRLGHWRCRIQEEYDGLQLCDSKGQRCVEGWLSYKAKVWNADKAGRLDLITDDGLLPLLRACRLIYSEAVKTLYSKNVFHFYDPGDIRHFGRALLPQRLNELHSIMMDWERTFSIFNPANTIPRQGNEEWKAWRETWSIIASMKGLKELRVILKSHKLFVVTQARRMKMCVPMMGINDLRVFELIIPWDDDGDWAFAANAPFTIVKSPDMSGYRRNP